MDLLEAIRTRRSIGKVKPDPVDPALVGQLLEAAALAPNHHLTEPWQFFVLTGDGRKRLGHALADIAREKLADSNAPEGLAKLETEENKALRAPVVIVVAVKPSDKPKTVPIEETLAVAAGIENMLLAAHALGLGAIWRTGAATDHPRMKALFGLGEQDHVLGFIYVGYPDMTPAERRRTPYQEKTVWIEAE